MCYQGSSSSTTCTPSRTRGVAVVYVANATLFTNVLRAQYSHNAALGIMRNALRDLLSQHRASRADREERSV